MLCPLPARVLQLGPLRFESQMRLGQTLGMGVAIAALFAVLLAAGLVVLPWGIRRYNWLGLRDMVQVS